MVHPGLGPAGYIQDARDLVSCPSIGLIDLGRPSVADRRLATEIAKKIDAPIALGRFSIEPKSDQKDLQKKFREALRDWFDDYRATFKPSFEKTAEGHIRNHLVPFFGDQFLSDLTEKDVLRFIEEKLSRKPRPLAPRTIETSLSILRTVMTQAERDGTIPRNPLRCLGRLMQRVSRADSSMGPSSVMMSDDPPCAVDLLDLGSHVYPLISFAIPNAIASARSRSTCAWSTTSEIST